MQVVEYLSAFCIAGEISELVELIGAPVNAFKIFTTDLVTIPKPEELVSHTRALLIFTTTQ